MLIYIHGRGTKIKKPLLSEKEGTRMKSTMKSEITQATIARGTDNTTGEVFYVVASDTQANTWYTLRWNATRSMWCCSCPATCAGCKHSTAVNQVLAAKRLALALSCPQVTAVEPTEATEALVVAYVDALE